MITTKKIFGWTFANLKKSQKFKIDYKWIRYAENLQHNDKKVLK